jgi:hypothetical protein
LDFRLAAFAPLVTPVAIYFAGEHAFDLIAFLVDDLAQVFQRHTAQILVVTIASQACAFARLIALEPSQV